MSRPLEPHLPLHMPQLTSGRAPPPQSTMSHWTHQAAVAGGCGPRQTWRFQPGSHGVRGYCVHPSISPLYYLPCQYILWSLPAGQLCTPAEVGGSIHSLRCSLRERGRLFIVSLPLHHFHYHPLPPLSVLSVSLMINHGHPRTIH